MLVSLFITLIYQPFLNIVVFFYWMIGIVTRGHPDMGIAVIMLTILIRILLLPMSLREEKSEKERRQLAIDAHHLEEIFASDPIRLSKEKKKLFQKNQTIVAGELISLAIQVAISLMLWRMFETGLPGNDVHLLYPFLPKVDMPFNLVFLGKYDLTHTNAVLNIAQSVMIFFVETASILTSPYPPGKGEVVRMQFLLPVISFIVFLRLPAGKKLFVISTLTISLILILYKYFRRKFKYYVEVKQSTTEAMQPKILVETKI